MRTIGVITTARSDYGIYLPLLKAIVKDPELDLFLYVTGMHLSPEFGSTYKNIEQTGFEINERIDMLISSDTPAALAKSVGVGTLGFAQAFSRYQPDILLVLGDRFEMFAAVCASLPFKIPLAHIHGGELSEGAIDDAIRHAITKMSHLHFVATDVYSRRVIQMGEEPWRVTISGAPGLDNLHEVQLLSRQELQKKFGLLPRDPCMLITYHPVTLEYEQTEWQIDQLLAALQDMDATLVFTYPNADTSGRLIIQKIQDFVAGNNRAQLLVNIGTNGYFSLMSHASVMVGNSSSGIIEAASFGLPVVNIGNRQRGRLHGQNVIDVGNNREEIVSGLRKAMSPEFRESLEGLTNLYGDGFAAERIVDKLIATSLDERLLIKRFYDA